MLFLDKRIGHLKDAATLACLVFIAFAVHDAHADVNMWPHVRDQAFGDRPIQDEDGMVVIEAPEKVEDAGLVPLTVRVPPSVKGPLKSLSLFIDNNPDPKVAKLTFGPAAGAGGERSFSTRVRVDNFSYVRAVLETEDGSLHMTKKFLAAAGGCAAMQAKDPDADAAGMGKMMVRTFPPALQSNTIWAAQVMLKHPQHNGMQLDINTAKFIPALYIKEVTVKRDGHLVFKMDATFSLSTNPNFRFTFGKGEANNLDVVIVDTAGAVFSSRSQPNGS